MSKKILTTVNGKLNRRWFNNRVLNGTIKVHEINFNDDKPKYKEIDPDKNFLSMLHIYDEGEKIRGSLGTSFYYNFSKYMTKIEICSY